MSKFVCSSCGKTYPTNTKEYKCECGGLFKLSYYIENLCPLNLIIIKIYHGRRTKSCSRIWWKSFFKDRAAATLLSHCKNIGIESVVQAS